MEVAERAMTVFYDGSYFHVLADEKLIVFGCGDHIRCYVSHDWYLAAYRARSFPLFEELWSDDRDG